MKLLDTSVLVDLDRGGVGDRAARLDEEGTHGISTVTVTELQLGVNKRYPEGSESRARASDAIARLLARFEQFPVTRAVATRAADIIAHLQDAGTPLNDLHDVYVAATAQQEQLPVLTANVGDFDRIPNVRVVDWATY